VRRDRLQRTGNTPAPAVVDDAPRYDRSVTEIVAGPEPEDLGLGALLRNLQDLRRRRDSGELDDATFSASRLRLLERRKAQRPYDGVDRRGAGRGAAEQPDR
jgi:hypothetical protein